MIYILFNWKVINILEMNNDYIFLHKPNMNKLHRNNECGTKIYYLKHIFNSLRTSIFLFIVIITALINVRMACILG